MARKTKSGAEMVNGVRRSGCYKLDMFINEVTCRCEIFGPEYVKNVTALHEAAKAGDCQFNRRCHMHMQCPVAQQTRPHHCRRFYTKND